MEKMQDQFKIQQWQRMRAQGWWRFVLLQGVLKMGGSMVLVLLILVPVFSGRSPVSDPLTLLVQAAIYAAAGFAYGAIIWRLRERLYASSNPSDQADKS
jgi:hypothetical protein